ncbi:MAG: hypothetical protein Q7S92_03525 [Candidatus Diapherotrites archaeon]|nr:hypothetical protein [Candidatus Diapherotrites archaeon]
MNFYVKAILLTIFFMAAGLFIVYQLDLVSIGKIRTQLDDLSIELETSKLMFLYSQSLDDQNVYCSVLERQIDTQAGKLMPLLSSLGITQREIFLGNLDQVKKRYFLANAELYYYLRESNKTCSKDVALILYFYTDQTRCADCEVQGEILDRVRTHCSNAKIFAFPIDFKLEMVNLYLSLFDVSSAPAIVIDEKETLTGLQTYESIVEKIHC